jgi:hypothetical protein
VNVSFLGEHMNPAAPKTFEVLKWVLSQPATSQRMIARSTNVSLGQINKVFSWLEGNNFIERIGKNSHIKVPKDIGPVSYRLINPTGILRAISFFRSMKNNRILELNLDLKKEKVIRYLKKQNVIFCLDSALEKHDSYFRGDTICCYIVPIEKIEDIKNDLTSIKYGLSRIEFYSWDFKGLDIRNKMNSLKNYTTEEQTIIDLFCDNKAHYTKELLRKKWGIEL